MQTLASRQVLSSTALNRRGAQLRPSRPAAAGHGRALRAAPRAAYCRPGAGWGGYGRYGGFSNDEAMRMMAEMAKQMNGAGFVFPGGRVWFGVDMDQQEQQQQGGAAAAGASCGAEQRQGGAAWRLPVDLFKEADAYVITADIPGVTKSDLTIKLTAPSPPAAPTASLLIRGARKPAAGASDDATPVMRERRRGEFERRVVLPDDAASTGITARVKEGVLTVRVPRVVREPSPQESDIPVM